jgi:uracil-DNA glycosylase family 4
MDEQKWSALNAEIIACRRCPRLVAWRENVAKQKRRAYRNWEYWGKPVPGFGDHKARVLVVGLAPGAHGSNRTGRMFTGDASGEFLYAALHRAGFASQPVSNHSKDGLHLQDIFITAICRCAPPDNKPAQEEMLNCRPFLLAEMDLLSEVKVIVALGRIAFDQILAIYRSRVGQLPTLTFRHGALYQPDPRLPWLLASYHPSRQNTQTGRLSVEMFAEIWSRVKSLIS